MNTPHARFAELHATNALLVLPNAWDAGSALPRTALLQPGIGTHPELLAAGVRRLSAGPALYAHAWSAIPR